MFINIKKFLNYSFVRFLIAGGFNTLFGYGCFAILFFIFKNKEIAVTLELLISVFFNYNMSARFVFRDKHMTIVQIIRFYMVYFITYPINLIHLRITVDIWGWNVLVSQFVTLLYLPIINYILQRKLVFN